MAASPAGSKSTSNRRSDILEAAAKKFVENGFAQSTLREIATDCGIQAAAIYYYFPSKTDILTAVHEEGMRQIRDAVETALEHKTGPWERLEAAATAHLHALLEGGVFFQAVMQEMPKDPAASQHIIALRDAYEGIFDQLLDDLNLPAECDLHDLRLMLLGAMNWSYRWYKTGGKSPAAIAQNYVRFLRQQLDDGKLP
jgi:TetR/AcrR family transcriptional regulator, cholesterol catabolism regulator